MRQAAAQPVEPPADKGVARGKRTQSFCKRRTVRLAPGDPMIPVDLRAAGFSQRIELQIKALIVGRNSCVANPHACDAAGREFGFGSGDASKKEPF